MAATNIGRILTLPKGDWNATATYSPLDLVIKNDITYFCKKANTNIDPLTDSTNTYWMEYANAAAVKEMQNSAIDALFNTPYTL